jgi:hypothetical protein
VFSSADNIVGTHRQTPRSPGKANDNLPEENTFPPLATLASWRLIRANRFNYYAG